MNLYSIFVVLTFSMFEFSKGEECINFEQHQRGLARCCDVRQPFPISTKNEKCEKYASKNGDHSNYVECWFQCCYESMGIISENAVNQVNIAKHLRSLDEDTQQFLQELYVECAEIAPAEQMGPCNSFAKNMVQCVMERLDTECPENHFHSSPICDKQRDGMQLCP